MDVSEVDRQTLALIEELQLLDLEEFIGKQKGKHREGETPDSEHAIEAYKLEIEKLGALLTDHFMARSISFAVEADGAIITEEMRDEDQLAHDQNMARGLETNCCQPAPGSCTKPIPLDDEYIEKLNILYGARSDEDLNHAESSAWAASRAPSPTTTSDAPWMRQCISCQERFDFINVARCPCSHEYCRDCLSGLFQAATTDESLFPPRCCGQRIPLDVNRIFLPVKLVGEFNAKKLELETPNRTYCHDPVCSTFVPVQFIRNDVATCVRCHKTTCTICKAASHDGDCPDDPATQELLRLADENHWQRCTACGRVCELHTGCFHMTCLCKHQFCYVCGQTWKTCACDQWNEDQLITRATEVAQRDANGAELIGQEFRNRVAEAREHIIQNHECNHRVFTRRTGPNTCEECHFRLPNYIFECTQCRLLACRRCRFNRL